ncbi:ABC transporter permease [Eisenbergiella sp.]|uniref:ABC transporter permease n=1 Tax=Eisenbergiella sp. TaxID=1924109 RepID=UPI0020856BCD|nr:ABC transporter permease subunit [Eisenbergiella sp.]BDF46903.1 sugar ABC transporter permease [Lachnospiraceae bacterium]GKH42977.1 sugar ABC transporter permease [Lachnospiraceae bacterium]
MIKKKYPFGREINKHKTMYLMALPTLLYFVVFSYIPMLGVVLAFKRYNYNDGILHSPWVGLSNFKFLFQSGTLTRITVNTILYNLAFLILGVVTQVGVALLLNEIHSKLYRKITQSFMFLPYFISYVVLGVLVYNIFSFDTGLLNNLRSMLGLEKFSAYTTPGIWKYVLVFLEQWKGLGYGVVVYMAAITGISAEYYESAKIDGANHWQEIRYISLPLLKPTIIIITLFAVGKIMKGQFELFYQVIGSNGVLYNATDIIDTYVFRSLTQSFDVGLGSAAGFYQSLFGLVFIMLVNGIVKRINPEYALF